MKKRQTDALKQPALIPNPKAMFGAVENRDVEQVSRLLSAGVDPNSFEDTPYRAKYTVLMHAAFHNFPEAVALLLGAGAAPNDVTGVAPGGPGGETALLQATRNVARNKDALQNHIDTVSLLLDAGGNPYIAAKSETAYSNAARSGHVRVVELFIQHGFLPNAAPDGPLRPFRSATAGRPPNPAMLKLLLKHGCSVDEDASGSTPLMAAAHDGSLEIIPLLLESGAEVNRVDSDNRTPLIQAARFAKGCVSSADEAIALEIVKLLVSAGARLSDRDFLGKTASDYAAEGRRKKVHQFLKCCEKGKN